MVREGFSENGCLPVFIRKQQEGPRFFFLTIFTNSSARAGYDTRSIFKRGLTGLNSVFSFS